MNANNPLFSIIIVNLNYGKYLEDAIKSVIEQSCADYEIVLIDGGSSDDSLRIIKKYENYLAFWVSEPDNGQSNAFNKGFKNAKGKYFFWLNADDLLLPKSLKYLKTFIIENPNIFWFAANTIFFNDSGTIVKCSRGPDAIKFLIKNAPIPIYGPTSIFHRDIFTNVGGVDEGLHYTMDTDLWMRFNNMGIKFKRIHKYFWGFRIHKESKTSNLFLGYSKNEIIKENAFIIKKNRVTYTKSGYYKQFLYKTVAGYYLKSLVDTLKFRGKNIYEIFNKL